MPGLRFAFAEMEEEIIAAESIFRHFLHPSGSVVLKSLREELQCIRAGRSSTPAEWCIRSETPLKTKLSDGAYECGSGGRHCAHGEITSTWSVVPSDPSPRNRKPPRFFEIEGKASVRLRIVEDCMGDEVELAMWHIDIADDNSPGCFFHVQVLGDKQKNEKPPFPHSLSIPRLPSFAFSPMAALEFLIGELFQDEWKKQAGASNPAMTTWAGIQRKRLSSLLKWKLDIVKNSCGSPWTAVKTKKPDSGLFCSGS